MTLSAPTIALFKKVNHVKTYRVLTHILRNGREENPHLATYLKRLVILKLWFLMMKICWWNEAWTSVLSGHIGFWHFWQVCPHKEFQKMVVISFEHLEKISNFPKLQGWGSKNEPAMPISNKMAYKSVNFEAGIFSF